MCLLTCSSLDWRIRSATIEDREFIFSGLKEIWLIEMQAGGYVNDELDEWDMFEEWLLPKTYIIEDHSATPCGFVSLTFTRQCPFGVSYPDRDHEYCFLSYIFVAPDMRRKNLSLQLLYFAENKSIERGIKIVRSGFELANEVSAKWHSLNGFASEVRLYKKALE